MKKEPRKDTVKHEKENVKREPEKKEQVKEWYDGFIFGSISDIYNPWSIINYLDKGKLGLYWINTSSNSLAG